jgi:uncharacterized damage-inducible protein DinB
MNSWEHLFLTGEFAPRAHILDGLTLEQVSVRPAGAPHSIYEELWHAAAWQKLTLDGDEAALKRWEAGEPFPEHPAPESLAAWDELVEMFLGYSERAVRLARDESWLESPETERNSWRVGLESLAVHNAYHMGKIVLLRQLLGIWSPPPDDA